MVASLLALTVPINREQVYTMLSYLCLAVSGKNDFLVHFQSIPNDAYISKDKVLILPLGRSGYGKSNFVQSFAKRHNICLLSRDDYMMESYRHLFPNDPVHLYQRVSAKCMSDPTFQERWLDYLKHQFLNNARNLFVLDTELDCWDTLYSQLPVLKSFLKIAVYLFPQNMLGTPHKSKNTAVSPWNEYCFPRVYTETLDNPSIDIGTGCVFNIPTILFNRKTMGLYQTSLLECVKKYKIYELEDLPLYGLVIHYEKEDNGMTIQTISYQEHAQELNGCTRDYRGETILYDKKTKTHHLLRGTMKVFKDGRCLDSFKEYHFCVTPQFDGSLMNITFIPRRDPLFEKLQPMTWRRARHVETDEGLFYLGSKNKFCNTDQQLLRKFERAMGMPFEQFIRQLDSKSTRTTYHFEALTSIQEEANTVSYHACFCKYLGCTTFGDTFKRFHLPDSKTLSNVDCVYLSDVDSLKAFIQHQHEELVNGNVQVEPEGFVIHLLKDNQWQDFAKYKFKEYHWARNWKENMDQLKTVPFLKRFHRFDTRPLEKSFKDFLLDFCKNAPRESKKDFAHYVTSHEMKLRDLHSEIQTFQNFTVGTKDVLELKKALFRAFPHIEKVVDGIFNWRPLKTS